MTTRTPKKARKELATLLVRIRPTDHKRLKILAAKMEKNTPDLLTALLDLGEKIT